MEKRRKFEQRIGNTVENFLLFSIKKHLSPSGCAKKLCRGVARLARWFHIALRLTPRGKSFFATTQYSNNVLTVPKRL